MAMACEPLPNDLEIKNLTKKYQTPNQPITVLQDIQLIVKKGEFLSIVGVSGCGKSTLLRLISGLEKDYSGEIIIGSNSEPEWPRRPARSIRMVFQEHRLLPWLTVKKNVAFGLEKYPKSEQDALVREYLELVGLGEFADHYPHQLSGGMQQRVAIARALVNKPAILLLDEPFGSLDALTRIKMQQEILRIWEREGTTMILVTHDIEEAIYLGDRIAVMSSLPGTFQKIVAVDLPRPRDRSISEFVKIKQEIYSLFFNEETKV